MQQISGQEFDYVIVGAGSSGAALANRLSEDPSVSVCLLEAGGKDKHPLIHIPFGLSLLSRVRSVNWDYNTEPQAHLNDRKLYWPRGKTLGGSSSVNAMCYIRGAQQDYDDWAELGATGWDWQSVLPYFKKSQDQQRGPSELHGVGGPLGVDDLRHTCEMSQTFVQSAHQLDVPVLEDFNGSERDGLGFYQVTQVNGQRCSAAKGYLKPAFGRKNLTIKTKVMVEKVLFEDKRAVGVQLREKKQGVTIKAKREVLVCGGAINSPQLLMLSGIGPQDHLKDKGIHPIVDLPGVGQNLQDHLDAIVQNHCEAKKGYAVALSALPQYIKATFQYAMKRLGIFSSNIAEAGGFVRSSQATDRPDLQFHFLPAILQDHGRQTAFGYGYGVHVCCLYPKSRGSITLASSHPADHPVIQPNYLDAEEDRQVMIDGVRQARKILSDRGFAQYQGTEWIPGKDTQTDEEILAFIREKAETIYHPIGTCKMGSADDEMAVVDPELKVRGVEGLRVIDASVMPTLIGGNTNAPAIMIAEKAADMIKQEWQAA